METCFPLLCVLFPSHCTTLAASRLDRSLLLAICMSLLCLSRIFPRAGRISACTQPSLTAAQRLRRIEECSQRENRASSELLCCFLFFFFLLSNEKKMLVSELVTFICISELKVCCPRCCHYSHVPISLTSLTPCS